MRKRVTTTELLVRIGTRMIFIHRVPKPDEKPSHLTSSSMLELIQLHPLAHTLMVPSKEEGGGKEANGPALTLIRVYNALNRSPKGLAGWINRKRAFLCRKKHSQPHWEKKKKRLIDRGQKRRRGEETALFCENIGKGRGEAGGVKGWQSVKEGETKPWLQSWVKERRGFHKMMDWRREGGRRIRVKKSSRDRECLLL